MAASELLHFENRMLIALRYLLIYQDLFENFGGCMDRDLLLYAIAYSAVVLIKRFCQH